MRRRELLGLACLRHGNLTEKAVALTQQAPPTAVKAVGATEEDRWSCL
jgi:hypothetical protein